MDNNQLGRVEEIVRNKSGGSLMRAKDGDSNKRDGRRGDGGREDYKQNVLQ